MELENAAAVGSDRCPGPPAETGDPDDLSAGLHDGQAVAVPPGHLGVDEKGLEPALAAATEGPEPIATAPGADDERPGQPVGVEGHQAGDPGDGVPGPVTIPGFEDEPDFRQLDPPGDRQRSGLE